MDRKKYLELCYTYRFIKVAEMRQTDDEILENIITVIEQIGDKLKGGFANIRSINLLSTKTPAIPIYVSIGEYYLVSIHFFCEKFILNIRPTTCSLKTFWTKMCVG